MRIREFHGSDINQVVSLFYETVHSVNAADYSIKQLNAWAPRNEIDEKLDSWNKSLSNNATYVAEINGKIVGFSDMTHNGYLDRLYTHKDFQGQGIATALVSKLESVARKIRLSEIYTEASVTAKPFFEHRGYQITRSQNVERKGVTLPNFQMIKKLVSE
ncbi:GNAT family N-acetyltransferase [Sporosarcina sp. P12(2017)]|uniref:GNAT family N-acetyltransferase n=1 Tax=unclassified Sporosarcina TaxID=2647733 RepID=UPI000C16B8EC|nr:MULTISPECIES: GNAT family N-acetyltransferase [unclassified Sporosarcina]PIC56450.1 GNAT family N-acetyltransferase [Sporosarcina sp. P10]PIC59747.1 GNAT family N-acetyltransferase [Sporosarcina sp. P12(2017)]